MTTANEEYSLGSRVSGYEIKHTPETNGLFKRYDYVGIIEYQCEDPQLGRINYIRIDVPIPSFFGDGYTVVHFEKHSCPLTTIYPIHYEAEESCNVDKICVSETFYGYTNTTPEEILQFEEEGLFTKEEIEHMKKCVYRENSMIEAEMLSCDDLLAASEMYRLFRDNTFYRKQEEAAASMGFTIKYI